MKLPKDVKRGTFEMSLWWGTAAIIRDPRKAYLLGALAIYRDDSESGRVWRISHARTGTAIPYAYRPRLTDAIVLARRLDRAINWSTVRRSGGSPGFVVGMTDEKVRKLRRILGVKGGARG